MSTTRPSVVSPWTLLCAKRAHLEFGHLIEAEGDHALELGDLARGEHLADNGHLAAQLANRVVCGLAALQHVRRDAAHCS
eukprot:6174252-Pleurochrysis_carterae.AAC.3